MTKKESEFDMDDLGFIQIAATTVLAAIARNEIDLNRLAREELANRGLDLNGHWVGFKKASKLHNV